MDDQEGSVNETFDRNKVEKVGLEMVYQAKGLYLELSKKLESINSFCTLKLQKETQCSSFVAASLLDTSLCVVF